MTRLPIVVAAAVACAAVSLPATAQQQSVKIGFISTFSGPIGVIGQHTLDGFQLGVEHAGGKLGGLNVEIVRKDDQLKPDVGLQAAKELLERDRVDIVTGIIFSNIMMAVYKPIVDNKTFLISSNAGPSPIAGAQCSPFFFSTAWQNDQPHEAMGKHLQDKGIKKLYLMAPNYQAGKDALTGVKRYFKGEIVDEVYTPINQPDYSAEIAQLRAARPEAVYVFYPGGLGVNFTKQYAQSGLTNQIPMYSAFTIDTTNLEAIGEAAVGTFQTAYWNWDLKNPDNERFVADFRKKYGYTPSNYSAQAYDAALLIDSALKATSGKMSDKDAFRAALKKADFKSIRGKFTFNTNGYPIQNFYLLQTAKGADGKPEQRIVQPVFENYGDVYAKECPLK